MELALLIIVAALVIALIYITKKRKALEDEGFTATSDTSGTSGSTSTATNTQKEEEKPSGPPQNTIYEFSSKAGKRLCPFCDGENSAGAKVCNICGRDI